MKTINIISEEELKELGNKFEFLYEPNEFKCNTINSGVMYNTFEIFEGKFSISPPIWEYDSISNGHFVITKEQIFENVCRRNPFKYVHVFRVFIPEESAFKYRTTNFHGHQRIQIVGHTRKE